MCIAKEKGKEDGAVSTRGEGGKEGEVQGGKGESIKCVLGLQQQGVATRSTPSCR